MRKIVAKKSHEKRISLILTVILTKISAGLRHKLSKLQLRAPGHPKGPPCIQRGPQKEKKKKRNTKSGRKIAPTTLPPRIYELHRLPPSKSGRKIAPTTPLEFTNFIDYPPRNRAGKSLQLPPLEFFLWLSFPPFFKLRAPHRLNPALTKMFGK